MTSRPRPTRRSPEFRRRHRCSPQPGHRDLAVTRLAGPVVAGSRLRACRQCRVGSVAILRCASAASGFPGAAGGGPWWLPAAGSGWWPGSAGCPTLPAMGLIQTLEYEVPEPNAAQRAMWQVSSSRPGAWLFAKSAHHIDRFLLRLSRGQVTLPRIAAGIPVITIVTTGARTGQRRTTPLLGVPIGDDLAIIGTRFGQRGTPGWYYNIRASPAVEVAYRGKSVTATAREAGGEEWQDIWERAREIYAGYEIYARRIQDRQIHIMILSMQAGPAYRSRNDLPAGSAYPVRELADVGVSRPGGSCAAARPRWPRRLRRSRQPCARWG